MKWHFYSLDLNTLTLGVFPTNAKYYFQEGWDLRFTKDQDVIIFSALISSHVSVEGVAQPWRVHTDRCCCSARGRCLSLRLTSSWPAAASRGKGAGASAAAGLSLLFSSAALCCCSRCTAVPSRPLSPSPFLLLLLLPIYRLLTLLFHQSESSRCNSNTCCTNMKIANAVSDGCWLPWSECDPFIIAAGLCLVVPPWRRGEALLPRVPVRRSPPQLRPQPEDREECTEPVQQWTRQFGLLGIRSGLCTCLQD